MRSSGSPGSWPPSAAEFRCVPLTLHSHPETSNSFPEFDGMLMAANRAFLTSHAPARVRIGTPSARAEASAHARSRPACSSRHAARQTRASTRRSRRSRRAVSICSLIGGPAQRAGSPARADAALLHPEGAPAPAPCQAAAGGGCAQRDYRRGAKRGEGSRAPGGCPPRLHHRRADGGRDRRRAAGVRAGRQHGCGRGRRDH